MTLTPKQQLRKLQLAIDHIDAVIDDAPGDVLGDLYDALDALHDAESGIEQEQSGAP